MGSGSNGTSTTLVSPAPGSGNVINPTYQPYATAAANIGTSSLTGQPIAGGVTANPFYYPANYQVPNPQQVAALTPLESAAGGTVANETGGMPTPTQQTQAGNTYNQFQSSNFGASPAVQAALKNYNETILPQVQNRYSMQNLGNSGMENFAEGQSAANAMIPLYQQDLSNQLTAAAGLNTLGQEQVSNNQLALQNVMNYGSVQRGIQNAANQAQYQDFLRLMGGANNAVSQGFNPLSSSVPAGQTQTVTSGGGGAFGKSIIPFILPLLSSLLSFGLFT